MERGFLPPEQPLEGFDDPYYEPWEWLSRNLAVSLANRTFRQHVLEMPYLSIDRLQERREMQRAYTLLSFFTQAWIWQRPGPCEKIPQILSKPYLAVCEALGMVPTATFAAYCLWNWRLKDANAAMQPENLSTNVSFTGLPDESWFFSISTAIEWLGAQLIHETMTFIDRIQNISLTEILDCNRILVGYIRAIQTTLLRMREGCDPETFYWKVRPFLAGSANMESSGLPQGIIYEQECKVPHYQTFSGGSNAQSSLLQYIDALIGREDHNSHSREFMQASYSEQGYTPADVPAHNLTHLIYGFALIRESGQCDHYDKYGDVETVFGDDDAAQPGNNVFGNVNQILKLKGRHRHLKTIISIGGWRLSETWSAAVSTPERRSKFVDTCMHCMYNFGWDGIDLAWIFPKSADDANNYVELVKSFREAIDDYATRANTNKVTLSVVAPIHASDFNNMKVKEMDPYVDFWNMMAYGFNGDTPKMSDANHAVHSAPWTISSTRPSSTPFAVQSALELYLASGVIKTHKINLGISLYGRAFYNNIGPGHSFGILENDWLPHLYPKKALPLPGAQEYWDSDAHASYSYDSVKRMMVSYENRKSLRYKIEQAIQSHHMGGLAFWDVTADGYSYFEDADPFRKATELLGGPNQAGMDMAFNTVHYPLSDKDNVNQRV
ncbi:glycoside hydrolase family 18 protein [Curvularia clavata]|uniref:Indoleamine 2,3-dioxygenase n=1 Tax=Curvularia clavata TaxID=95742 RepID=A0A9Q8YZK0_CURCL|nr:glycoside hydrolase family 18 protein [Curvularia clavata]